MRFWDSSALASMFVRDASTPSMRTLFRADSNSLVWTLTDVEFRSALCRRSREGLLSAKGSDAATAEFERFWANARVISAIEPVKERAKRLLGVHALRAGDSLQLAAALVATYDRPARRDFVTLDVRLADAARREGFRVLP